MKSYMTTRPSSRLLGVVATLVVTLGCATTLWMGEGPGTHFVQRDAKGCSSCVTVAVTAIPGPLPDLAAPPASPIIIGYLANVGEGGRHEKRYDLKPNSEAEYKLQLSSDGTRIRWTILEKMSDDSTWAQHRTGHLARCDTVPPFWKERDINFKDCSIPNTYDPIETAALKAEPLQLAFVSSPRSPLSDQPIPLPLPSRWLDAIVSEQPNAAPAWVSCKSGCCTLAAQ